MQEQLSKQKLLCADAALLPSHRCFPGFDSEPPYASLRLICVERCHSHIRQRSGSRSGYAQHFSDNSMKETKPAISSTSPRSLKNGF